MQVYCSRVEKGKLISVPSSSEIYEEAQTASRVKEMVHWRAYGLKEFYIQSH